MELLLPQRQGDVRSEYTVVRYVVHLSVKTVRISFSSGVSVIVLRQAMFSLPLRLWL
jgi:hypothetical protein